MFDKEHSKCEFKNVALAFIILGAAIFAVSLVAWVYNYCIHQNFIAFPSVKAGVGLILMALGYVVLELELIRKK